VTLAAYLAQWLQQQRSQLQPSTWESYRSNVERYLVPALGEVALGELSAAQLSAFYAKLQRDGGQRSGRPLALRTVQFCHGVLHKALADAVRFELVDRNVAVNADLPRVDLRGDGVRELRAWTAGMPLHDLWHVAVATGMRRGELLGLRWDDVDLDSRALSVRRALSVVKGQARLKEP
jgi:integrase